MSDTKPRAIVRRVGWMEDETGRKFFGAVVEFLDEPPDHLTYDVIWSRRPVEIVVLSTDEKVP